MSNPEERPLDPDQIRALEVSAEALRILTTVARFELENQPEAEDTDPDLPFAAAHPTYGTYIKYLETGADSAVQVQIAGEISRPDTPMLLKTVEDAEDLPQGYAELLVCFRGVVNVANAYNQARFQQHCFWEINDETSQYHKGVIIVRETQSYEEEVQLIGAAEEAMKLLDEAGPSTNELIPVVPEDEQALLWVTDIVPQSDHHILSADEADQLAQLLSDTELRGTNEMPVRRT